MKERYRLRIKIERIYPDGACSTIAKESHNLLERAEVRNTFRSAVDEADRAWRSYAWDEERREQRERRES